MSTPAEQAIRKARLKYARTIIAANQYVVCVCGQLFHEPDPYADHVETCSIARRQQSQTHAPAIERD